LGLKNVRFTGYLPHRVVFEQLCEAEVLLFLSKKVDERLPNVVKEAMAARCACVVSRTTGIEELVPAEHGFIVEQEDLESAAAKVLRLLREPDLRERMVTRALAHLEQHFDLTRSMTRYRDTWEACVAERWGAAQRDGEADRRA
jgi:glycosyltransferase involved in cell wall biosynthesis